MGYYVENICDMIKGKMSCVAIIPGALFTNL